MNHMRDVYLVNYLSPAAAFGIGTYLKEYIYCLQRLKYNIYVLELQSGSPVFKIEEKDGIKKFLFPYRHTEEEDKYARSICQFLKLYTDVSREAIFHFHYDNSENLIDLVRSIYSNSKILFTIHYENWIWGLRGNIEPYKKIIKKRPEEFLSKINYSIHFRYEKEKRIYEKADKLICLSDDTYHVLTDLYHIGPSKIHLIPNGLRDDFSSLSIEKKKLIRKKKFLGEEERIFLYVGRLDEMKGISLILSAFSQLLNVIPDARLVIVGVENGHFYAFNKCNDLYSRIIFTGVLSQKELKKWYQIADIGLILSYGEQCSYTGIEMMMHGLPIIASDGYGVRCMFKDQINSWVVPLETKTKEQKAINNLSEQMELLLKKNEVRNLLKRKARRYYKAYYSIDNMCKLYYNLLNNL